MLEALVDVALRAVLASVVLGGILALGVLAATRALALTASTQHALWTTALLATAIMPLAGIGMSWAKAAPAPTAAVAPPDAAASATAWSAPHHPATYAPSPVPPPASNGWTATVRLLAERLGATVAAAERTPRLTHTLALGVIGAWLLGAAIGLAGLVASLLRVRGLKKRSSPLDGELADELPWLTETRDGREIYLRLSYETETPVAIGFGRPVILIPTELATADGLAAIESLVLHEYAHLRRYDDWTNLVQRVVERIFWFNPVVWIVGRRIALEREIASDDAVVERTGAAHAYATSLWRLAREMRMPEHAVVAPGALLTRKQISVRIEQLLDKNRARLHRSPAAAVGAAFAAALAVGVVATSAPAVELPAAAHEAVAATSPSPASPQAAAPAHAATQPHAAAHQPMSPHEAALAKRLAAAEHQLAQRAADARRQRSEAHVEKRVIILADTTAAPSLASLPPIPPTPKTPAMPATPPTPPTPPTPSSSHDTRVMIKKLGDTRTMVGIDIGSIVHDAMTTSAAAARSAQVAQAARMRRRCTGATSTG